MRGILLLCYVPHSIGIAIVAKVKQSCGRLLILIIVKKSSQFKTVGKDDIGYIT